MGERNKPEVERLSEPDPINERRILTRQTKEEARANTKG